MEYVLCPWFLWYSLITTSESEVHNSSPGPAKDRATVWKESLQAWCMV